MKTTQHQLRKLIRETMELDLEIGDVILTGKFKNKRTTIKEMGVDENGQPTINGRPMLKFRIEKKLPEEKWSSKTKELHAKADLKEANMKITKRQLRRIIKEYPDNPNKIRRQRRIRDRDRMIDQMTFKQLKSKAFDSALFIQGRLDTGQYEYADIWEAEIPRLADYIDAAKVKAAEEGVTYDDIPEVRHRGGILDLSKYSLGGLPAGIKENKIKITKQQLKRIIREALLTEDRVLNLIRDEVSDVVKKDLLISNYIGYNEPNVVLAPYGTPGEIQVQLSHPELVPPEKDMAMAAARFKRDLERLNPGYTFDIELDMYSAKDSQTFPEEDPDGFYRSSSASATASYNITVNKPER